MNFEPLPLTSAKPAYESKCLRKALSLINLVKKRVGVSINAPFLIFLLVSHMNDDPQKKFQKSLQHKTSSLLKNRGNIVFHMFFTISKSLMNEGLK